MTTLRTRTLLSLAAAAALLAATPALAQNYEAEWYGYGQSHPYDVWGRDIEPRQNALERAVQRAVSSGQLGRNEARRLPGAFGQLNRLKAQYRRGGYTRAEVNDINRRLEWIEARLRSGGGHRGRDRYDRDDYGRYGRDDYGRYEPYGRY